MINKRSEVSPTHDVDQRTCRLAAVALWHVLAGWAAHEEAR